MLRRAPFSDRLASCLRIAVMLVLCSIAACGRKDRVMDPLPEPPEGMVVSGQVRDPDGTRLPGAVITMEHVEQGLSATVRARIQAARPGNALAARPGFVPESHLRSTVSDHQGRFSFDGVTAGGYLLTGTSRHHLAGVERIEVRMPPVVSMVETTYVDIALTPTGSFYGNVTLENATNHQSSVVYVQGTSFVAVTNPSGGYVMSGVPVGTWTVRATHPTYRDGSASGTIAAGDSIPLTAMNLLLDSNIRPIATAGDPGTTFMEVPAGFSGTGSDDDGTIQRYEWDFDNDGVFDYSSPSTASTTHAYPTTGTYTAKLRVTDDQGGIGLDAVSVVVLPAVFVSSTTGNNGNPGTKTQPVATIAQGYTVATSQGIADVLVATGDYSEVLSLVSGKNVRGGYDPTTWAPLSGTSRVLVGTSPAVASGISATTIVSRLTFEASNAPPNQNSIALRCASSGAAQLRFFDCVFKAGNGGASTRNGSNGVPGNFGNSGSNGAPGTAMGLRAPVEAAVSERVRAVTEGPAGRPEQTTALPGIRGDAPAARAVRGAPSEVPASRGSTEWWAGSAPTARTERRTRIRA